MTTICRNRIGSRNQPKPPQDGYHYLSDEDFMALIRAFKQVFGLLCFRETKHFRHASTIEPKTFSSFDQYQALVHMVNTANKDENDDEIKALRSLMVSYLGPLDHLIHIKLAGRQCYGIVPKVWLDEGTTH